MTPNLDEPAGEHFTFRDLCEVGETWERLRIDNAPSEQGTYDAMRRLTKELLDPLTHALGRPTLTYGFASADLNRHIKSRIAPALDQHGGHDLKRSGALICDRLGQAVDLHIPGRASSEVAQFIVYHTPFDRLYFYGDDRPLHVSVGPSNKGEIHRMVPREGGLRPLKAQRTFFDAA